LILLFNLIYLLSIKKTFLIVRKRSYNVDNNSSFVYTFFWPPKQWHHEILPIIFRKLLQACNLQNMVALAIFQTSLCHSLWINYRWQLQETHICFSNIFIFYIMIIIYKHICTVLTQLQISERYTQELPLMLQHVLYITHSLHCPMFTTYESILLNQLITRSHKLRKMSSISLISIPLALTCYAKWEQLSS